MKAPYFYCQRRWSTKAMQDHVYVRLLQVREGKHEAGRHVICIRKMVPDVLLCIIGLVDNKFVELLEGGVRFGTALAPQLRSLRIEPSIVVEGDRLNCAIILTLLC